MPTPFFPGDDRCLAGLCAALEASRSELPERVLAGFAEAMLAELAACLHLHDELASVRALTRDRRAAIEGELRLPGAWLAALAEGRMVRATGAELAPGERTLLRLTPTTALLLAPVPAPEGPPGAALLLASDLAHETWSSGQEQALRGLASGLAGWFAARSVRQVLDHLPQRVAWKDAGLRYRGANRAFTRSAGLAVTQLLGRADAELPLLAESGDHGAAALRREQQALTTPQTRHLEATHLPMGREQWFEVSRIPLAGGGLLVVRDEVSARVQLAVQLQQARRLAELGRLATGVGDALAPIATEITAAVGAAHSDPAALARIEPQTRALEDLARQLAAFARRQIHEPVDLVPGQILTRMEPTLARLLGQPIELQLAPPALRCAVRVDPRLFELLLASLALHARACLGGRGRVGLEVAPETLEHAHAEGLALPAGEYVRLRVQAEVSADARPVDPGPTLRLALARSIAAQAGGGVQQTIVAGGLRLDLRLPRVFSVPRPPGEGPVVDLRGAEPILLVEDDPMLAQTLTAVLRHLGYDVRATDDIAAAIDLLESTCSPGQVPASRISLALLPCGLAGAGEALRRLRGVAPELRVLWLASHGAAAPALDPLVVPCTFEALALRVRQALEAPMTPMT